VSESDQVLDLARSVFADRFELARAYVDLLSDEGIAWGLIGPREADRLWERHVLNSVCLTPVITDNSVVADIGSGAGLPGIPLAIARPDLHIDLVEPMQRRIDFLTLCVERLGLSDRVSVVRSRVEEYRGRPDVVTCRALAPVGRLVEWVTRTGVEGTGSGSVDSRQATGQSPTGSPKRRSRKSHGLSGGVSGMNARRGEPARSGVFADRGANVLRPGPSGGSAALVPPGVLLAIKGARAGVEVEEAASALQAHRLSAEILRPIVAGQELGTVVRVAAQSV
jgi:16S rRNA (guanine527-N7)-methyltransferase